MTEDELLDQLGDVLNELRRATCDDMVPLWLESSRRVRRRLAAGTVPSMGFEPSAKYRKLSAGNQSNYRALASWRQVVVWRGLMPTSLGELSKREADGFRAATRMYFTPFPTNVPPYAHSRKAPDDPLVHELGGPALFKDRARHGAAALVERVQVEGDSVAYNGSVDGVVQDLIKLGAKSSLRNTLKMERVQPRFTTEKS